MPDLRANRFVEIAIILAVCAFLFFYGLGSFGLLGADEPRYAQIGSEMLARHDWIVPTLNGTPWLEKPPLLYWGEMASYAVFGMHDWAARAPVSCMTTAMVLAIYFFVRRRLPEWAMDAALITASLVAVVGFGRGATTDMPLTACFTIAMLACLEWLVGGRRAWLLVSYAFSALGMLAKGPVGPFLAGMIIVVFALINAIAPAAEQAARPPGITPFFGLIWKTLWWPGILLFLAISLPWYIAVQMKTGDFFRVFILEHNLARFGTNLYRHRQPFWYYLPVALALTLPWTAILLAQIVRICRRIATISAQTRLVLLWLVTPIVFFSISQSKLPGYVLPSIPAATLLIVAYLHEREEQGVPLGIALLHASFCGALFAGTLLAPHFFLRVRPPAAAIMTAAASGILIFATVAFAIIRRGVHVVHAVTLIPVLLAVAFVVKVAAPTIDVSQSARPLAGEVRRAMQTVNADAVLLYHVPRPADYGIRYYIRGAVSADNSLLAVSSFVLVTPSGTQLPAGFPGVLVQTYAPQRIDIYFVPSRMPRQVPRD